MAHTGLLAFCALLLLSFPITRYQPIIVTRVTRFAHARLPMSGKVMARASNQKFVENLKPDSAKRLEIPDGALVGLYLITPSIISRRSFAMLAWYGRGVLAAGQ
jgi:hypothetical protein